MPTQSNGSTAWRGNQHWRRASLRGTRLYADFGEIRRQFAQRSAVAAACGGLALACMPSFDHELRAARVNPTDKRQVLGDGRKIFVNKTCFGRFDNRLAKRRGDRLDQHEL